MYKHFQDARSWMYLITAKTCYKIDKSFNSLTSIMFNIPFNSPNHHWFRDNEQNTVWKQMHVANSWITSNDMSPLFHYSINQKHALCFSTPFLDITSVTEDGWTKIIDVPYQELSINRFSLIIFPIVIQFIVLNIKEQE